MDVLTLTNQSIFFSSRDVNYFSSPRRIRLLLCGLFVLFILSATVNGSENTGGGGLNLTPSRNFTSDESYITIDPIPDPYVGDIFSLSGTTNISPEVPVLVEIFYSSYHALGKQKPGEYTGSRVNATIVKGATENINTWAAVIDTRNYASAATDNDWIVVVTPKISGTPEDEKFKRVSAFRFKNGVRQVQSAWVNTSQKPEYWIHLDPVSDKHGNDSFVITGTTNIPAGEKVDIAVYSTLLDHRKNPPPQWSREYSVTILAGTGENTSFATPIIYFTPSRVVNGVTEQIWPGSEYLVVAEYPGNTSVEASTVFTATAPGGAQTVSPTVRMTGPGEPSTGIPATTPRKSSFPLTLAILSLGVTGMMFLLTKK